MAIYISPLLNAYTSQFDPIAPICTLPKANNITYITGICQNELCASANLCIDQDLKSNKYVNEGVPGIPSESATRRLMEHSSAAYCQDVEGWNCNNCLEGSILYNVTSIQDPRTDVHGFVGVDHDNQNIVVSFRGSTSILNWLLNSVATLFPIKDDNLLGESIGLHRGFYSGVLGLYKLVKEHVHRRRKHFGDYKLQFTGHSLGGGLALAMAFHFLLNNDYNKDLMEVVTFAQPLVGNLAFVDYMRQQGVPITNFFNEKDWVPKSGTLLGYKSVGNLVSYPKLAQILCLVKRNGQEMCDDDRIQKWLRKQNLFPKFVVGWNPNHQSIGGFIFDPFCASAQDL